MKTTSHKLKLSEKGLETFCLHLSGRALLETKKDEKTTQYLMPDRRTTLDIRRVGEDTYLDITTTTIFQPRYVRKLISSMETEFAGESSCPNRPNLAQLYNYSKANYPR